jgi:hypothetical protein
MKDSALAPVIILVLGVYALPACAPSPAGPVAGVTGQTFTGEVWVWDEQRSTVTLRRLTEIVRVKVSRDQLDGLRLHQMATVRGEVEQLAPIQHDDLALTIAGPRGGPEETELSGTITTVDGGTVRVDASGGAVQVWTANHGGPPLQVGDAVLVSTRVQPLELRTVDARAAKPTATPEPVLGSRPGHYAAVRGRIIDVQPQRLTVLSPRGPVVVSVPAGERYAVGDPVEVHTAVSPAR